MVEIPNEGAREMTAVKMAAPLGAVRQVHKKNVSILRRSINKESQIADY